MSGAMLMTAAATSAAQRPRTPQTQSARDWEAFENEVRVFLAEADAISVQVIHDARVRLAYQRQLRATVADLRARAQSGRMTWAQAAREANALRNDTMGLLRSRSTPQGAAIAEILKKKGMTLDAALAKYTQDLFGANARFDRLNPAQQQQVHAAVVEAAGRANPRVNRWLRHGSRAARGLIVLSLGVAVYNVYTAEDRVDVAKREAAVMGAGVVGGVAAGAAFGLLFGPPGALVGGIVGGAAAAFGVDYFW